MKQDVGKLKDLGFNDSKLNELIDQYYKLDFEDIISGGIKTRFKVLLHTLKQSSLYKMYSILQLLPIRMD